MDATTNQTQMIVGAKNIAAETGLSPRRIYALVDQGKIPVLKIGSSIAIRRASLATWLDGLERSTAH
jgi:excisionase family DNA binding protein